MPTHRASHHVKQINKPSRFKSFQASIGQVLLLRVFLFFVFLSGLSVSSCDIYFLGVDTRALYRQ